MAPKNTQAFVTQLVAVAGVDEVGRGPLAGPVTAQAHQDCRR